MSYNAEDNFPNVDRIFGHPLYADPIHRYILDHLDDNPIKAMQDFTPEAVEIHRHQFRDATGKNGVVIDTAEDQYQQAVASARREIELALRRFNDLDELQENGVQTWCGREEVRKRGEQWVRYRELYRETKKANPRGVGHHPSMSTYDSKGREYFAGIGSDAGRVRKFDTELFAAGISDRADFTKLLDQQAAPAEIDPRADENVPENLIAGEDYKGCPVCSYQKQYDTDSHNDENNATRAVMMHMRNTRTNVDEHRAALMKIKANT